jgi:hypothetical protein
VKAIHAGTNSLTSLILRGCAFSVCYRTFTSRTIGSLKTVVSPYVTAAIDQERGTLALRAESKSDYRLVLDVSI